MGHTEDAGGGDELAGVPERRGGRHRFRVEDEGDQKDHRSDHAVQVKICHKLLNLRGFAIIGKIGRGT